MSILGKIRWTGYKKTYKRYILHSLSSQPRYCMFNLMATQLNKFQDAVDRLTSGTSRFELIYKTDSSWPLSSASLRSEKSLQISILDSSFNPPTLAHAALGSTSPSSISHAPYAGSRLLLLSISNADKTPNPGDATPVQRLEMMIALADELAEGGGPRVAVAALNEPTFIGKSTLLLKELSQRVESEIKEVDNNIVVPKTELIFQMGWDTIIRVFAPRYYPSPESMLVSFRQFFGPEGSAILCARRPIAPPPGALSDEESEFLSSPYVQPFYKEHKIELVDLDSDVKGISSGAVRKGTIKSAERMCTPRVVRYIQDHRLYYGK